MTLGIGMQFLLIGVGAALLMLCGWLVQLRTKNSTIVDVLWSAGLGAAGVFAAATGEGEEVRRMIVGVVAGLWAARLAGHLIDRGALRGPEDARYAKLREAFPERQGVTFFLVFEVQAVLILLLCVPFVLASASIDAAPSALDYAAALVWLTGFVGESISDWQLERFKRDADNKGKVCDIGLWRYSRHPNYFFEWVMWCAFALLSFNHSWGAFGLVGPLLIYVLLTRVSGIPPSERRSLESRGEAYRAYQERTNAFFPWIPKRESSS